MATVNNQIIDIVNGELKSLVSRIAGLLVDQGSTADSSDCRQLLKELAGTCTMLEVSGARRLIHEVQEVVENLDATTLHAKAGTIAEILDVVPRYIAIQPEQRLDSPCLVLPEISKLRQIQGKSPLYESQLLGRYKWPADSKLTAAQPIPPEALAEFKRLRHLYQVGLLDVLKNRNRGKAIALLARVTSRIQRMLNAANEAAYWSLVERVLLALGSGELGFTPERLRLLSAIEKQLKLLALPGDRGGRTPYPLGLWQAFSALLALTTVKGEADRQLRASLGVPELEFSDMDIGTQRQLLLGEEDDGLAVELGEIKVRLSHLHSLLELFDDGAQFPSEDRERFDRLTREIAEICNRIGLMTAAERFAEHRRSLESLCETSGWESSGLPRELAQSILYLECLQIAFAEGQPTEHRLRQLDARPMQQVVEENLLATARNAVYTECLQMLATAKEFMDEIAADFADRELVPELAAVFDCLRGTAILMGETRVVDITWRCRDFVLEQLLQRGQAMPRATMVATFADAVVSLEYHFEMCAAGERGRTGALEIADEYLAVLGA